MERPLGQLAWTRHAAELGARYPLTLSNWTEHSDCVEAGFYLVSTDLVHFEPKQADQAYSEDPFFSITEPPLSPEEEEEAAAAPQPAETLF